MRQLFMKYNKSLSKKKKIVPYSDNKTRSVDDFEVFNYVMENRIDTVKRAAPRTGA